MKLSVSLIASVILPAHASFVYTLSGVTSCSDSVDEPEFFFSLDQNEIVYENFKTKQQISRLPSFVGQVNITDVSKTAFGERDHCLQEVQSARAAFSSPPQARVPPEISIYPKHDVVSGEKNNFICFITSFYPPHINVNWSRNGVPVTEGVYISQFSINDDGTFNSFSTLTSSPNEGDEYSCTVEHEALDSPQTRTWDESAASIVTPSVTPTVVFAVGIAVGILGLAIGIFFVVKALRSC